MLPGWSWCSFFLFTGSDGFDGPLKLRPRPPEYQTPPVVTGELDAGADLDCVIEFGLINVAEMVGAGFIFPIPAARFFCDDEKITCAVIRVDAEFDLILIAGFEFSA